MSKKGRITIDELLASRENDSDYIARTLEYDLAHERRVEQARKDREPVNSELRSIGILEDYATFPNTTTPNEAFPILLKHLKLAQLPPTELGVLAKCFAHPSAADYWDSIVGEFKSRMLMSDNDFVKDGLAISLGMMCSTRDQLAELYELIEDRRYGAARILLMDKVRRADIPLFQELFERLVEHDEVVRPEILSWKSYWKRKNPALLERWRKRK